MVIVNTVEIGKVGLIFWFQLTYYNEKPHIVIIETRLYDYKLHPVIIETRLYDYNIVESVRAYTFHINSVFFLYL